MKNLSLLSMLLIFCNACQVDSLQFNDESLLIHYQQFKAEANNRGVELDINESEMQLQLVDFLNDGVVGQCNEYSNHSKEILIDSVYWNQLNYSEQEYVLFHELGHCILQRGHKDEHDEHGFCQSIMQSGEGFCLASYHLENRELLIDELFEESL